MAIEIITTSDGSHSLLNTELNETYHSTHGALRESLHVFLDKGFDFAIQQNSLKQIHILEIGFGTGLNALLTLQRAIAGAVDVYYTSLEAYPLHERLWQNLNYAESLGMQEAFYQLHHVSWESWQTIHPNFRLLKREGMLQLLSLTTTYDVIYFDAFAPSKQPEMWEFPVLEKVVQQLNPRGTFVTYCAKGQLKRDLKTLGLHVETLEGPPGKKEMVRAVKN